MFLPFFSFLALQSSNGTLTVKNANFSGFDAKAKPAKSPKFKEINSSSEVKGTNKEIATNLQGETITNTMNKSSIVDKTNNQSLKKSDFFSDLNQKQNKTKNTTPKRVNESSVPVSGNKHATKIEILKNLNKTSQEKSNNSSKLVPQTPTKHDQIIKSNILNDIKTPKNISIKIINASKGTNSPKEASNTSVTSLKQSQPNKTITNVKKESIQASKEPSKQATTTQLTKETTKTAVKKETPLTTPTSKIDTKNQVVSPFETIAKNTKITKETEQTSNAQKAALITETIEGTPEETPFQTFPENFEEMFPPDFNPMRVYYGRNGMYYGRHFIIQMTPSETPTPSPSPSPKRTPMMTPSPKPTPKPNPHLKKHKTQEAPMKIIYKNTPTTNAWNDIDKRRESEVQKAQMMIKEQIENKNSHEQKECGICHKFAFCNKSSECQCEAGLEGDGKKLCSLSLPVITKVFPSVCYNRSCNVSVLLSQTIHHSVKEVYCKFKNKIVMGKAKGSGIECVAPKRRNGIVELKVSFDKDEWSLPASFEYKTPPVDMHRQAMCALSFSIGFVIVLIISSKKLCAIKKLLQHNEAQENAPFILNSKQTV